MGFLNKRRTRQRTSAVRIPVGVDTSGSAFDWLPLIDLAVVASMSHFNVSGVKSTTVRGRQNALAVFVVEAAGGLSGQTRIFIDLGVTRAQQWAVSVGTLLDSGERALDFTIRGQLRRAPNGLYEQEIATVEALTRDGRLENGHLHDILRDSLESAMATSPDFEQLERVSEIAVHSAIDIDLDKSWQRVPRAPLSATIETKAELGEVRAKLEQMMPEARVEPGRWLFDAKETNRTAEGALRFEPGGIRVATALTGDGPLTNWRDLVPNNRLVAWWDLVQIHVKTLTPTIRIDDEAQE